MILADTAAERAVLAGICRHGSEAYFDVADIINGDSFTVDSNSVIFSCIKHLFKDGEVSRIDVPSILSAANGLGLGDFFSDRQELSHLSAVLKFPVLLDNVRKFGAKIRKLQIARMMYDQLEEAKDKYLHVKGDEPISHILGLAEESIFNFTELLNDTDDTPQMVFEDIDEYLKERAENQVDQVGISTGLVKYDFAIGGGLRAGTVNVIGARPKALAYGSRIYMPEGFKAIEDIKVGDTISHPVHGSTTVTHIWDHENVLIYRIHFKDGDYVDCCKDHLWHVYKRYPYDKIKNKTPEIKTTESLINDLIIGSKPEYKWDVPMSEPTIFVSQPTELDPYILGLLLGDGSFRNAITFTTADVELSNHLFITLDNEIKLEIDTGTCKTYRINSLQNIIRNLGLYKKKAKHKFIPKHYIYNDISTRLAVLRGLMDTDGDCTLDKRSGNSRCRYSTISKQLALDIKEIVQSLGGLCSIVLQKGKYKGKEHLSYRCEVRLLYNPFHLKRKAKKFKGRKIGEIKRSIVNIEEMSIGNARCITVDNPDGLFITDNYVVTHNCGKTIMAMNVGVDIAKRGIPVLDIDTEMRIKDHKDRGTAMLSYDTNAKSTIGEVETGQFANNDFRKERLIEESKKYKKVPYYHKNIGGKPFEDQLSMMRRWIAKVVGLNDQGKANDCVIIYDYLKLMDTMDMRSSDLKEFQLLGFMMTALHNFALRYEVPMLVFIQLNRDGITKESTDTASGSDRVIWLCSNFTIYKTKSDEEVAKDGPENGNRKLVPVVARHGEGLEHGDYINMLLKGRYAKLIEGKTAHELEDGGDYEEETNDEEDCPF
jgi:replicative DNA helicase